MSILNDTSMSGAKAIADSRDAAMAKLPFTVLSAFLGARKTTLLNLSARVQSPCQGSKV